MGAILLEAPKPEQAQRAFANRVKRLEDAAVRDLLSKLEAARRDLAAELAGTDFERHMLPKLRRSVDRALGQFQAEYAEVLEQTTAEAWVVGENGLPELVSREVGKAVPFPALDPGALSISQELTGELITELTDEARTKISAEIQRGLMGDRPITDVMKRVGRNLDDPSAFRSVADRAEVITRTETNRIFNIANNERDAQFADLAPDLGIVVTKRWISARIPGRTRTTHFEAHGQEVPLDQPFIVGGEKLMFPLDPAASARNTVNCLCKYRRVFSKGATG